MKQLLKEIPRAIIISISIFFVLLLVRLITGNTIQFNYFLLVNFGYSMFYGLSLYFSNAIVFIYLDTVFKTDRFTPKRIFIGFLSSFFISIVVIFLLRIFEDVIVEETPFSTFLSKEQMSNYLVAIIITFFVTLAFHAFYFYKAYNENKVKEQKVIAGTASAKFESLKNQIDPHFLFNSLNVLSSLIEENPENAQRFTTSLSKIYRYVLEQKDKELVPIEEELAFAKTYMNLLKMRFEDSITFEISEDAIAMTDAKVVPLSLQLLLENTIKHNIVSEKKPLHITIFVKDNYLVVQNDLQKKEVLQDRRGVGLQNIISRYGILTNRKVLIQETAAIFAVHLPILTKQVMVFETTEAKETTAYSRAKKRVEALKGFYGNLISYCVVIPTLIFINLKFMPEFQWFWFSMIGWGIGLTIHGFSVFGYGANWEERKIKEILERQNGKKNWN